MAKILYVEDEPDIRAELVEALMASGHKVAQAANGFAGLRVAIEFQPEIIVCDCLMPAMTGPEMILTLRRDYPEFSSTPMVLLSASADESHLKEARAAGANAYLTKPMDFDELEAVLRRLLDERQSAFTAGENSQPAPAVAASKT
ncbi:MAG: response regulator [Kiloniellales bacterium]|nr:response regulator [Kiloniellales bacterium]